MLAKFEQPLVDSVDHFACLFAGGVETEVHPDDETVEVISNSRSSFGKSSFHPRGSRRSRQQQIGGRKVGLPPSVATRYRSAAIALRAPLVRSLMTYRRMAGQNRGAI